MMKPHRWIATILAVVLAIALPLVANALTYEQINAIAAEITVIIDGCTAGSGVIFDRDGDTYSVLTAHHVVETPNFNSCLIVAPNGDRYSVTDNWGLLTSVYYT